MTSSCKILGMDFRWRFSEKSHVWDRYGRSASARGRVLLRWILVLVFGRKLLDELLEWRELSLVDEVELLDEEDEVLEAGVEVRLLAQFHDLGEVLVVYVGVDAEQALQDRLGDGQEVLGERDACKRGGGDGWTSVESDNSYNVN